MGAAGAEVARALIQLFATHAAKTARSSEIISNSGPRRRAIRLPHPRKVDVPRPTDQPPVRRCTAAVVATFVDYEPQQIARVTGHQLLVRGVELIEHIVDERWIKE